MGISAAGFAVALCDPNGCIPGQLCAGAPAGGVVGSITGPATTAGLPPAPTATATYATNLEYYSGVAGAGRAAVLRSTMARMGWALVGPPASPASRRTQPSSLTPSSGGQWILRLSPEACVRTGRRPPW